MKYPNKKNYYFHKYCMLKAIKIRLYPTEIHQRIY